MTITINEKPVTAADGLTLGDIAKLHKPGADLLILNGFPVPPHTLVSEGDELFLIRRGEIPSEDELQHLLAARHTPGVHARLKQATVGIAGVGGLGSAVAVALARAGIGNLVIADFDVVEPSNLNRQQYFINQIGLLKVYALSANLRCINPYTVVTSHPVMLDPENIPLIFAPCSLVVEAFDRPEMKAMLVETVLDKLVTVRVVAASGLAGFGPNNDIVTKQLSDRLFVVGDFVSEAKPGSGLMAPRVGIAAHHQANQVLRLLLDEDSK